MNIIENENLVWERFQKAVTNEDINVCYDMSLKDFEHSGVHDLFKVFVFCLVFKYIYIYIYIYYFYFLFLLLLFFFYFDHLFFTFL